jgi:hypothetical protein
MTGRHATAMGAGAPARSAGPSFQERDQDSG